MRFILPEPDSIPGWSREKCWFLAPFLSISAPLCSLRLLISLLLPCWLSSEVSVMRAWTERPVLKKCWSLILGCLWSCFQHASCLYWDARDVPVSPATFWNADTSPWVGPETCWYHAGLQGWDLVPRAPFEERNQGGNGGNRRDKKRARV